MPSALEQPPLLIQDPEALIRLSARLRGEPRVAVDTESNSLYAYQERVCLIQLSVPRDDYLVDPLAVQDLAPLGPVFSDPSIEKVFHGAEYDLACLRRDFGFEVRNLFDTRIAIRTLGHTRTGLGHLLAEVFDVQLDKRKQRANWGRRPLRPDLLNYARLDTHFLIPLRERLRAELVAAGRLEEAAELCTYLTTVEAQPNQREPSRFWRLAHGRSLSGEQLAVLHELYHLRERLARRLDRPTFKVMGASTLLAVATALPPTAEALKGLPGMTAAQIRRHGPEVLAAVQRGRRRRPPRRPTTPRVPESILLRYDTLRQWRKGVARQRRIESDLVLPRQILWEIARQNPADLEDLRPLMQPLEWRFRTYGPEILRLLQG
jgi:ribonuclease D